MTANTVKDEEPFFHGLLSCYLSVGQIYLMSIKSPIMKIKIIIAVVFTALLQLTFAQDNPENSYQKIARTEKEGAITRPEAIGLQVLAFFADKALPSQYRSDEGADNEPPTDLILEEAMRLLPDMPVAIASRVYLYLLPEPFRPKANKRRSFEDFPIASEIPAQEWTFLDDLTAEIRVWYLKDDPGQLALANLVKNILANEAIPSIKTLMGRTHLRDDLNNTSFLVSLGIERKIPNGGDGKLDVYIYNIPAEENARGMAISYPLPNVEGYRCPARPAYIAVDYAWANGASRKALAGTLAHEYFHVVQATYNRKDNCSQYSKLDEATATYIKQYVYPKDNEEHSWFQFAEDGRLSLMDAAYESWNFYYWLTEMQGKQTISSLYTTMDNKGAMDSVDAVLKGGFKKNWVEYLVYEWNQDPLQDGFRQWDNYTPKPGRGAKVDRHLPPIQVEDVVLNENGQFRRDMNFELKPLTRDYYAFKIKDSNVRSIAIENPVFWNARKVKAKVMIVRKGQTSTEELLWEDNDRSEYHYCLDKKDEQIDTVIIAVGNFQHSSTGSTYRHTPSFKATNQPCHGFKGTMESVWNFKDGGTEHRLQVSGVDLTYIENGHGKEGHFKNNFRLTTGRVFYDFKGKIGDCTGDATGYLDIRPEPNGGNFVLQSYNVAPEAWGEYTIGVLFEDPFIEVTYMCPPPKKPLTRQWAVILGTFYGKIPHHLGKPLYRGMNEGQGWTTTWEFSSLKE